MKRKILSMIMCLVVLVGVISSGVVTSSAARTKVNKVDIFVDTPYAGRMMDFTAVIGDSAGEQGYGLYRYREAADGTMLAVQWVDETDGVYKKPGSRFIKGHSYRVEVGIYARDGYYFDYSRPVSGSVSALWYMNHLSVNGDNENANLKEIIKGVGAKDHSKYLAVVYDFGVCTDAPANKVLDKAMVYHLETPFAGNHPDFEVTVDPGEGRDGLSLNPNPAYAVNWYAIVGDYSIRLSSDDVFTVGTTYRVDVSLMADLGYRFKYDNPETPNMTWIDIEGHRAEATNSFNYIRDIPERELMISYTFAPCPGDTVSLIEITGVIPPAAGETPSYEAIMLSEACVFSDYEDSKNKNGACWYDYTAGDFLRTTDTFIAGHEYSITFELFAADGYRFDRGYVEATINGYEAKVTYYSDGDNIHYVEYKFAPCFDGEYIPSVDITNVVSPMPGEKPVYNATISEGCTITHIDWGWEDIQELMDPDYAFADGNTYGIFFWVEFSDPENYRFTNNMIVTVNGKEATYEFFSDGTLFVEYIFEPCGMEFRYLPGDANTDGAVNLSDVTAILQYIAKWNVQIDTDAADVVRDGIINLSDVTLLLKYIAKWNVVLG